MTLFLNEMFYWFAPGLILICFMFKSGCTIMDKKYCRQTHKIK